MSISRKSNWPTRLALFIEEKRDQPFKWGENDCCLFFCDWISILTENDPASHLGLRGTYDSALGAIRILEGLGGVEVLAQKVAEERGWSFVPVEYAQRGDGVIFQTEEGPAMGVCNGQMSVFAGPNGIVFRLTKTCSHILNIS